MNEIYQHTDGINFHTSKVYIISDIYLFIYSFFFMIGLIKFYNYILSLSLSRTQSTLTSLSPLINSLPYYLSIFPLPVQKIK